MRVDWYKNTFSWEWYFYRRFDFLKQINMMNYLGKTVSCSSVHIFVVKFRLCTGTLTWFWIARRQDVFLWPDFEPGRLRKPISGMPTQNCPLSNQPELSRFKLKVELYISHWWMNIQSILWHFQYGITFFSGDLNICCLLQIAHRDSVSNQIESRQVYWCIYAVIESDNYAVAVRTHLIGLLDASSLKVV